MDTYIHWPSEIRTQPENATLPRHASPAGVDVRADESVRPPAEADVMGSANGVADAAGLLKPKLKPAVDAEVVAAGPVKKYPSLP